ncbi:hypothetical protein DIRU0_C10726 [Diutina rugosa]
MLRLWSKKGARHWRARRYTCLERNLLCLPTWRVRDNLTGATCDSCSYLHIQAELLFPGRPRATIMNCRGNDALVIADVGWHCPFVFY